MTLAGGGTQAARLADLSAGGALLRDGPQLQPQARGTLHLEAVPFPLPFKVRESGNEGSVRRGDRCEIRASVGASGLAPRRLRASSSVQLPLKLRRVSLRRSPAIVPMRPFDLRVRLTECVVSLRLCVGRSFPSPIMCVGKRPLLCVGPFIIVRRYNQARIILTYLNWGPHQLVLAGLGPYRGRYRVAGQVPGSPSLICLSMPARSLRSRTRRAFARGPAALLDLRSARRPWGIRSGRRNDQSPIEQRNWETLVAQAGIAMAGSNGLPVFSTPKQITSSLRIAATTICLGLRRPACFRRSTSAMTAGL